MTETAVAGTELRCAGCEREIDRCACCDEPDCPTAICNECLSTELGERSPHIHEHGG